MQIYGEFGTIARIFECFDLLINSGFIAVRLVPCIFCFL